MKLRAQARATPSSTKAPSEAPRRRILFIEDHADLLASYERAFRHHEVELCSSGEVALRALSRQPDFDLVVCDVLLPGMDGFEVFQHVTALAPALANRFVFASAVSVCAQYRERLDRLGVPVLEKPFGMGRLRELLDQAARRS